MPTLPGALLGTFSKHVQRRNSYRHVESRLGTKMEEEKKHLLLGVSESEPQGSLATASANCSGQGKMYQGSEFVIRNSCKLDVNRCIVPQKVWIGVDVNGTGLEVTYWYAKLFSCRHLGMTCRMVL